MTSPNVAKSRLILALCAIYLIWGSTYLAIAVAVQSIPPLCAAALRFIPAGAVLYLYARLSGRPSPSPRHWLAAFPMGLLMLAFGNGLVCAAERRVPSGVAAVVVAITPAFVVGIPWLLGGPRPRSSALAGIALGLVGVVVLSSARGSPDAVDIGGLTLIVAASLSWAVALVLAPHLPLPSDPVYGSALPMLTGGGLLGIASIGLGEPARLHLGPALWPAAIATAYLALFGSIVTFTAYVWLQRNATPALATSNVYVNPVIALLLGWAFRGEVIGVRAVVGACMVLGAVALIGRANTATRRRESSPALSREALEDIDLARPPADGE